MCSPLSLLWKCCSQICHVFFCMAESRRLLAAKFAQAISDAAEAASSPAISGMDRARKAYEGLQFDFPLVEAEDLLALAIRLR